MLDRSRDYGVSIGIGQTIYHQDGKDFDHNGNEIGGVEPVGEDSEPEAMPEPQKRRGRPPKALQGDS